MGEHRYLGRQELRRLQVPVAGEGTDRDVLAGISHVRELAQTPDVDEHGRHGEPQLHEGKQRVTTRQHLCVVAMRGEKAEGLVDRRRPLVVEGSRDHTRAPLDVPAASTALTMLW